MASPTPTELAREASNKTALLQQAVDILTDQIERLDLVALRERVKVLEEQNSTFARKAESSDALREQVVVLEDRVNELKKAKEESDKRQWQFVYIAAGAGFALLSSLLVQLVFYFLKK